MTRPIEQHDRPPDERAVRALSDRSGVEVGRVRHLFRQELARLGMGAKVGSYLAVLTAANVRGMLTRRARQADGPPGEAGEQPTRGLRRHLQSWEDDGGSVRQGRSTH